MANTCVVGLQWGDEAKGKIVDLLSEQHDFAVRYNGGANAGHTVVWGDRVFKLSILPTGVLHPHLTAVIGNGLVVYPPRFLEEVEQLTRAGVDVSNLVLSEHAHVIFPYHMEEEKLNEQGGKAENAIGTTGRGIGPCYQDKIGRRYGIRVADLLRPDHLRDRLSSIIPAKNRHLQSLAANSGEPVTPLELEAVLATYLEYGQRLKPFVRDTNRILHDAVASGKRLLFEAAQGSLLDVDHGTFPYVTSSSSLPSGIWAGCGVSTRKLDRIIGVVKAYTTRVGRGPFPTELDDGLDGIGERIRKIGREYGTVTGRPRRTGWFDAVAVRYTAELADVDEITLMLLDVLSGIDPLKICVAYDYHGERLDHFPSDSYVLAQCKPIYEPIAGWSEDLTKARTWADLPAKAQAYIQRLSAILNLKVSMVSVGPDRAQTIHCQ
ncbi:adenylosuccinate synthase [Tuwongella immobilis]|uniref:Adenylosuccinate synthetase n=1 Tax=Tuwongella immobilis TaxID=692036 RepID=A0A6C2YVF6_9BACT|nr:adenylosuccinate synthase [Tuwongella immobilis]VIP04852.1 adenylosuccinate synthetase : Adenylosuccinate synthetase OS=Singulisphaera acidiphila (strain ATCC BAA-1392 / DSM 18658 / VKM B-2454 / MOB10) GN=purA PE=3 SV=1: Adenylsucc_synt [Tuwongella immobilis]VTS07064.1 adenylosuccinate synthetase : Adenylosuccinate synthetase OS=Singulisphaera acidiphila (strain ATCC BAA-1392 / DSM 18658 / VKM B-2454 / MOB10) GN=purA PE=3 SV=1: Adenylsucc_synt [Tuwongella immobilis]